MKLTQLKVRCHRTSASSLCDNCRASSLECSSNGSGLRAREAKTRVLISSQYEKKIDRIDTRLDSIEHLLGVLARSNADDAYSPATAHSQSFTSASMKSSASGVEFNPSNNRISIPSNNADIGFEGISSLTAHTVAASEFFRQEIESSSFDKTDPATNAALHSLNKIIGQVSKHSSSAGEPLRNTKPLPTNGLCGLPRPPMAAVLAVLHGSEKSSVGHLHSGIISCFTSLERFADLCLKIYLNPENLSQTDFITIDAGLYYIFLEHSFVARDEAKRHEHEANAQLCQCNLETAITNLNLMLPHTYETVEALLLGTCYAIEMSRAPLAWLLNSTAVTIGQTFGFHQSTLSSPATVDTENKHKHKALLFWMAYVFDKGLALRLGYAPLLKDNDFNISITALDSVNDDWIEAYRAWVVHAQIQERMYNQLYSAAALALPSSERRSRVPALVDDLRLMISNALQMAAMTGEMGDASPQSPSKQTLYSLVVHANLICCLGSLTLLYNGAGESYADDCLQSAREAMELHNRAIKMLDENSGIRGVYLHWGILFVPFVPFTVIFCHAIKSPNQQDLNRLQGFVHSLQSACTISDSIMKLYRVCEVFYHVAFTYFEMKSSHGFANNEQGSCQHIASPGLATSQKNHDDQVSHSTPQKPQTRSWCNNNQYMMDMLE